MSHLTDFTQPCHQMPQNTLGAVAQKKIQLWKEDIHSDDEKLISSKRIGESEHEEDLPSKKRKFSSQSKRKGSKSSKRQKDFSESDSEEVSSSKSQKFFSESENEDDTSDNNQKKLNKLLIEKKLHEKRKLEGETTSSKIKEDRDKAVIIRCSDLKKTKNKDMLTYTINLPRDRAALNLILKRRGKKDTNLHIIQNANVVSENEDQIIVEN